MPKSRDFAPIVMSKNGKPGSSAQNPSGGVDRRNFSLILIRTLLSTGVVGGVFASAKGVFSRRRENKTSSTPSILDFPTAHMREYDHLLGGDDRWSTLTFGLKSNGGVLSGVTSTQNNDFPREWFFVAHERTGCEWVVFSYHCITPGREHCTGTAKVKYYPEFDAFLGSWIGFDGDKFIDRTIPLFFSRLPVDVAKQKFDPIFRTRKDVWQLPEPPSGIA